MAVRSVVCCDATVRPLGLDVAEVLTEKHVIINRIETRLKYFSVYKREQRLLSLTKICLIIQGDLGLEKACKAISAVCLHCLVT